MSFFDAVVAAWRPDPEYVPPEWSGPPAGVLPGQSAQWAMVCRSEGARLEVGGFLAYPTGLSFRLSVMPREDHDDLLVSSWDLYDHDRVPDDFLLLGVLTSDGSRWTNLDDLPNEDDPGDLVLTDLSYGGQSARQRKTLDYWMWPLPPDVH